MYKQKLFFNLRNVNLSMLFRNPKLCGKTDKSKENKHNLATHIINFFKIAVWLCSSAEPKNTSKSTCPKEHSTSYLNWVSGVICGISLNGSGVYISQMGKCLNDQLISELTINHWVYPIHLPFPSLQQMQLHAHLWKHNDVGEAKKENKMDHSGAFTKKSRTVCQQGRGHALWERI